MGRNLQNVALFYNYYLIANFVYIFGRDACCNQNFLMRHRLYRQWKSPRTKLQILQESKIEKYCLVKKNVVNQNFVVLAFEY